MSPPTPNPPVITAAPVVCEVAGVVSVTARSGTDNTPVLAT